MENLTGKTAFITGSASGIGLGIAKACGNAGMNVVIADVRRSAIDEALPFFKERNWPAHGIELDVTDRKAYARAADEAETIFGKIHVLINNAGVEVPFGPLWKSSFNDCDYIVGVNIFGVLNGIQTILPRIIAHGEGGHVVSTASMAGLLTVPGAALYSATKHAVVGMMESLAAELAETNVGASAFCPGPVPTNITPSSVEVRPEALRDATPSQEPRVRREPPEGLDMTPTQGFLQDPEVIGERVVRGIRRGDIYILTHKDFIKGVESRCNAVIRAFPDEPFNEARYAVMRQTGSPIYIPIFDSQTTPGAPDWDISYK